MNLLMLGVYILGIIMGCAVTHLLCPYAGKLKIDRTNPEKDLYMIDLSMDLNKLPKKKRIELVIDANAKLSHDELPL